MKWKGLLLLATLFLVTSLLGCAQSSNYAKKSYHNITTALFDNDTGEPFLRGD